MINWKQYPFVKMLIPLCLGILANVLIFPGFQIPFIYTLTFFLITIVVLILVPKYVTYNYRWISGFLISVFLFLLSFTLIYVNNELNNKIHYSKISRGKSFYQIKIAEPVEPKDNSIKIIANVIACKTNTSWTKTMGSLLVYFEKDTFSQKLNYGDILLIYGTLNEIQKPRNPHEFDYKRYLANKNIYFQTYLKTRYVKKLSENKGNVIKSFAISLRNKLLKVFEDNGMAGREYAVISAILLGQTDNIDPELYKDYTGSGALHVLSVSGMHVGIIFISLGFFLSFMDKIRNCRFLKAIILLSAIWFYALLTGLSPSVIRAAAMISFIIIGKALKRDSDVINILSASVFVILCFNPFLLLEVGFQLSFLAVFGMVLFYDIFYKLWMPENKWVDKLWGVTCISVSAQIITTPLSLFYFHQFPNYFLLTNFVVFVFAAAVMYGGIIVILVSWIPFVSTFSAKILVWLIYAMNESIGFIEGLPFAVSKGINFKFYEVLLLYILLISIIYAFTNKNKKLVFAFLFVVLLMETFQLYDSQKIVKQQKFVVYSVAKTSAIDFFYGNKQIMIADHILRNDNKKLGFHIQNNRVMNGIETNEFVNINDNCKRTDLQFEKQKNFIQFGEKTIVIVENKQKFKNLNMKINVDYLILAKNCNIRIVDLYKIFNIKLIIFDASNKLWRTQIWENECKAIQLPFYNVLKSGAFVADMNI